MEAEIALLHKYRAEYENLDTEIRHLTQRRAAAFATMQGLEQVLRLNGVDPSAAGGGGEAQTEESDPGTATALDKALSVLREARQLMTARQVQEAIMERGGHANYSTLYKALLRESTKADGRVAKIEDHFVIDEHA